MAIAGVGDFTMSDLIKPEARRVRRSLSAVINLAKCHEDKLPRLSWTFPGPFLDLS